MILFGGAKHDKSVSYGRPITASELKSIYLTCRQRCERDNVQLPQKFEQELSRRIQQAGKTSTKSKLSLNNAGMEDHHVIYLVESLAVAPVLAKLDIRDNNFTEKGASFLLRLLRGQVKLIRSVHIDKRLHANFLGSIDIGEPSEQLSEKVVSDIRKYSEILAYCNAQTVVRRVHAGNGSPVEISADNLQVLWREVVGRPASKQLLADTIDAYGTGTSLTYPQCEVALLQELQESGAIPTLSKTQFGMFKTEEEMVLLNPIRQSKKVAEDNMEQKNALDHPVLSKSFSGGSESGKRSLSFSPKKHSSWRKRLTSFASTSSAGEKEEEMSHKADDSFGPTPADCSSHGPDSPGKETTTGDDSCKDVKGNSHASESDSPLEDAMIDENDCEGDRGHSEISGSVSPHKVVTEGDRDHSEISGSVSPLKEVVTDGDGGNEGDEGYSEVSESDSALKEAVSDGDDEGGDERPSICSVESSPGDDVSDGTSDATQDINVEESCTDNIESQTVGSDIGCLSGSHEDNEYSHPKAYLFSLIDRNCDGRLTLTEFVQALRTHPEVSRVLRLPSHIRQEDGSRDKCVMVFNEMDSDNSGIIDRRKFLLYVDSFDFDRAMDESGRSGDDKVGYQSGGDSSEGDDEKVVKDMVPPPISARSPIRYQGSLGTRKSIGTQNTVQTSLLSSSYPPGKVGAVQNKIGSLGCSNIHDSGSLCDHDIAPTDSADLYFSQGVLVAKSHGIRTCEVPPEVLNLIFESDNKYRRVRKSSGVHNVHTLVLSHNLISTVLTASFVSFTGLSHLDLSFNKITEIHGEFPPTLKVLKLSRNKISKIKGLLLCHSLREIDLSHNCIRSVVGLPAELERIDISDNNIDGELNLRMLSLSPKISALAIDNNPIVDRMKNYRARLMSLLPCLNEINHVVLPRPRKVPPRTANKGVRPTGSPVRRSRPQSNSPRRRMSKKAQQEADERRSKEYFMMQKYRENAEKNVTDMFDSMSRSVHKRSMSPKKVIAVTDRLHAWRPWHIKKIEEEQRLLRVSMEQESMKEQKKKRVVRRRKSPAKKIIRREEVVNWTSRVQSILSAAYELLCQLFDDIESGVHREGQEISLESKQELRETLAELYSDRIQALRDEFSSVSLPSGGAVPDDLSEEVRAWQEDCYHCMLSLKFTHSVVGISDKSINKVEHLIGSLVSSLQISEDGYPLEFVNWHAGAKRCADMAVQITRSPFVTPSTSIPCSPIKGNQLSVEDNQFPDLSVTDASCLPNIEEGLSKESDLVDESESHGIISQHNISTSALSSDDVKTRMDNLKARALRRAGMDSTLVDNPSLSVGPKTAPAVDTETVESSSAELKTETVKTNALVSREQGSEGDNIIASDEQALQEPESEPRLALECTSAPAVDEDVETSVMEESDETESPESEDHDEVDTSDDDGIDEAGGAFSLPLGEARPSGGSVGSGSIGSLGSRSAGIGSMLSQKKLQTWKDAEIIPQNPSRGDWRDEATDVDDGDKSYALSEAITGGNTQESRPPPRSMLSSLQAAVEDEDDVDGGRLSPVSTSSSLHYNVASRLNGAISTPPLEPSHRSSTAEVTSTAHSVASVRDDMSRDDVSAEDIFSRMGNLKEKIMRGSTSTLKDSRPRSTQSGTVATPERPNKTVATSPSSVHSNASSSVMTPAADSDSESLRSISSSKTGASGMSAMDRLKAKLAKNRMGKGDSTV